jgi:hypothetical protein
MSDMPMLGTMKNDAMAANSRGSRVLASSPVIERKRG